MLKQESIDNLYLSYLTIFYRNNNNLLYKTTTKTNLKLEQIEGSTNI